MAKDAKERAADVRQGLPNNAERDKLLAQILERIHVLQSMLGNQNTDWDQ